MARYVMSLFTPRAPADAFAYMADLRRFAEWDPGVTRAVQVHGDGPGPDAAYDLTVKAGVSTVMRYEVTSFDAPRRLVVTARTSTLTSVDEIRVEPRGTGSVVTYDAVLTLNGRLKLFDRLLAIAFRRIGDRAAVGLRRVLDGQPA